MKGYCVYNGLDVPINVAINVAKYVGRNVGRTERLGAILSKIKSNIRFTIKSLSKEFAVNEKTIERDLEILKQQNKIIFIGSKKSGSWKIIN
ncbi:MAG: DeoR family transcriptional regulator [Actinobacteria bacterium]|nr:DeoR family transcriptional regulator [Actinomycetota bacterium]